MNNGSMNNINRSKKYLKNTLSIVLVIGILAVIFISYYRFSVTNLKNVSYGNLYFYPTSQTFQFLATITLIALIRFRFFWQRSIIKFIILIAWIITCFMYTKETKVLYIILMNTFWCILILSVSFIFVLLKWQSYKKFIFIFPLLLISWLALVCDTLNANIWIWLSIIFLLMLVFIYFSWFYFNSENNLSARNIEKSISSNANPSFKILLSLIFVMTFALQFSVAYLQVQEMLLDMNILIVSITFAALIFLTGILCRFKILKKITFDIVSTMSILIGLGTILFLLRGETAIAIETIKMSSIVFLFLSYILTESWLNVQEPLRRFSYYFYSFSIAILLLVQVSSLYLYLSKNFNIFSTKYISIDMFNAIIYSMLLFSNVILKITENWISQIKIKKFLSNSIEKTKKQKSN